MGPDQPSEVSVNSHFSVCVASAIRSSFLLQPTKLIAGPPRVTETAARSAGQIQIVIAQIDGIVMSFGVL